MKQQPTILQDRHLVFEQHRCRLWGVAYRMLGSCADADDMVQEAEAGSYRPGMFERAKVA
jgi:DNA-directed RNA polymerase specialized sigma24 family protein